MAYPSISTTNKGYTTTNGYTLTANLPTGNEAGDLIIIIAAKDGTANFHTTPSGWTSLYNKAAADHGASVVYKILTESVTSVEFKSQSSEQFSYIALRIPGGDTPSINSEVTGNSDSPNPRNHSHGFTSGTEVLWIALCGWDNGSSRTLSAYPLSGGTNDNSVGNSSGVGVAVSTKTSTSDSEDIGVFTLSGTETWTALTIAVKSAVTATNVTVEGVIGEATASADTHTITTQSNTTVSGVIGEATASAPEHTISVVFNQTVEGVIGEATASADTHTITASTNVTIEGVIGESIAGADTHTITTTATATIEGVIGEAVADADTHSVSTVTSARVYGVIGEATASGDEHTISTVYNLTIEGVVGEAVAGADTHVVRTSTGTVVYGTIGEATASADTHLVYDEQIILGTIGEAVAGADAHSIGVVAHVTISGVIGEATASADLHVVINERISFVVVLSATEYDVDLSLTEYEAALSINDYFTVNLEVIGMAVEGSTVRLQAIFYDIDGNAADLDGACTVKIYSSAQAVLTTGTATRSATGTYYYDYTVPAGSPKRYWYEFSGLMNSKAVLDRAQLDGNWE